MSYIEVIIIALFTDMVIDLTILALIMTNPKLRKAVRKMIDYLDDDDEKQDT